MTTTDMITEKVTQAREDRPGNVVVDTFWIAYPAGAGVDTLGRECDRISQAHGRGRTRREALAAARGETESRTA